eukprot:CAMPEP_0117423666 /NCGR_PEP_ID=MMETSP0758-20121206/4233_1 /TAXON_ID=63605 /ORGANISM="Percolomonas cosmopolitus, Strain AE-1 (ATCC 50343)" /LENGTH=398 /DNA_ID=CAMNT_0005206969 /DNA_START=195 /DNA_END=1391 /DNA_ORIENTATION=+
MTFIVHPKDFAPFFEARDTHMDQRAVYKFMSTVFGKGVVYDAESSDVMMEQLRFVMAGLKTDRFPRLVQIVEEEVFAQMKQMGDEGEVDLMDMLAKLIIFTASRCLLGDGVRSYLENKNMAQLYHDLDDGISPAAFFIPGIPQKKRDVSVKEIRHIFQQLIDYRKAHPEDDVEKDPLHTLLRATYRSGKPVPEEHMIGILLAGLFAGQHTSSITSTWTLMNILKDPRIEKKVLEEQENVVGFRDENLTWATIKKMTYLENCMNEALRMFPPLIMVMRRVAKKVKVGNFTIPKGDIAAVNIAASSRLPDIYTKPNEFEPERFERLEHKKYPHSDVLFGSGVHRCLGENFARMQVKSIISILMRHYKFELTGPSFPEVSYLSLVATPNQKCMVSYKKRQD